MNHQILIKLLFKKKKIEIFNISNKLNILITISKVKEIKKITESCTNTTTNQQNNIDIDLTTNTNTNTQGEKSQSETWSLMRSRMATISDFILNLDEIKREANEMRDPNVYGKMLIANINNIQGLIDYLEKN